MVSGGEGLAVLPGLECSELDAGVEESEDVGLVVYG